MRDILFRGKSKDNGECVYGDLYRRTDRFGEHETIIFEDKGPDCFKKNFVDPETVCQYTGLTDKNGKKIFEGDILKLEDYHGHRVVYVFYGESCGCWFYGGDRFSDEYIFNGQFKEVIGNIFDNPELITEE